MLSTDDYQCISNSAASSCQSVAAASCRSENGHQHDVERVTAVLKNPYRSDIYWRNARDKMWAEIDVLTVVAKDAMPAMMKLATEIGESCVFERTTVR